MAFEGLSEKLNETFKRLRGKGRLTESDVRAGMREVRLALLEADVSFKVVKDFVAQSPSAVWAAMCWTASLQPSRLSKSSTKS